MAVATGAPKGHPCQTEGVARGEKDSSAFLLKAFLHLGGVTFSSERPQPQSRELPQGGGGSSMPNTHAVVLAAEGLNNKFENYTNPTI